MRFALPECGLAIRVCLMWSSLLYTRTPIGCVSLNCDNEQRGSKSSQTCSLNTLCAIYTRAGVRVYVYVYICMHTSRISVCGLPRCFATLGFPHALYLCVAALHCLTQISTTHDTSADTFSHLNSSSRQRVPQSSRKAASIQPRSSLVGGRSQFSTRSVATRFSLFAFALFLEESRPSFRDLVVCVSSLVSLGVLCDYCPGHIAPRYNSWSCRATICLRSQFGLPTPTA